MAAPTPKTVTAAQIATDVTKYGGLAVAVLEVVENAVPTLGVPGGAQAIIAAVVTVLTALLSVEKQRAVAAAAK